MAGCARTCILWLLGWAAAAAGFYVYFREFGILDPQIYWASGGAGLCVTLAGGYLIGIFTASRERRTLLEASIGTPPADGKWVAVSGPIHALNPLRAPLSGTSVVYYEYRMSYWVRSGKSSSQISLYDGKALTPSTIATRQGSVRLLAVPALDLWNEDLSRQTALENAQRYIESTQFQTRETPKDKRVRMEDESADDDGSFRRDDYHPSSSAPPLADCVFQEKVVKQNEMICAFGIYSQQRGGIIPHPNWAKQTRIMRGDAMSVANQLRNRMIKYAIGAVIFGAIAFGITKLYVRHAPGPAETVERPVSRPVMASRA
jgi:hypothetical protein